MNYKRSGIIIAHYLVTWWWSPEKPNPKINQKWFLLRKRSGLGRGQGRRLAVAFHYKPFSDIWMESYESCSCFSLIRIKFFFKVPEAKEHPSFFFFFKEKVSFHILPCISFFFLKQGSEKLGRMQPLSNCSWFCLVSKVPFVSKVKVSREDIFHNLFG